jgi:hypothetical protein
MLRVVGVFVACSLACGRAHFEPRDDAPRVPPGDALGAVGCADDQREGFVDRQRFPTIAGCAATWTGQRNLRAPRADVPCGDDLGACVTPVDACAIGWHICADQGDPIDLTSRATVDECDDAGGVTGSFVGAAGHCSGCMNMCQAGEAECVYGVPIPCLTTFGPCAEPVERQQLPVGVLSVAGDEDDTDDVVVRIAGRDESDRRHVLRGLTRAREALPSKRNDDLSHARCAGLPLGERWRYAPGFTIVDVNVPRGVGHSGSDARTTTSCSGSRMP